MNYWMTTHWPPLENSANQGPFGIYLKDGYEEVGREVSPGDHVLIYQSRTGRTLLRRDMNGRHYQLRSQVGRQGIVAIEEALAGFAEDPDSGYVDYADGTRIWWRWYVETRTISENGFVPLQLVNRVLGYSENCRLRGFGDRNSGLKKLSEQEYLALVDLFRRRPRSIRPVRKLLSAYRRLPSAARVAGESEEHRILKEYVAADPAEVLGERGLRTRHVEYEFPTGDRADLVLEDLYGRIVGVEIEVSVGPGQLAGVLQAIKYRFMLALVKERRYEETRAFLVAYSVSPEIEEICRSYDVEFFRVSLSDAQAWSRRDST